MDGLIYYWHLQHAAVHTSSGVVVAPSRQSTVMLRVAFDDEEDDKKGQRNPTSPEKLFP
jgi:hypothetical protein